MSILDLSEWMRTEGLVVPDNIPIDNNNVVNNGSFNNAGALFAVFDGHGGAECVDYAAAGMQLFLKKIFCGVFWTFYYFY